MSIMQKTSKLKDYLVKRGNISKDEFLQAEDYALTRKISLEQSLIFLDLLDYSALGIALAQINDMVYRPLLGSAPPESAKSYVPAKFADQWKIFPVNYDSEKSLLTLACADPDNQALISKLRVIFPSSLQLDFTIASEDEITRAIDVYYKGKSYAEKTALDLPQNFRILIPPEDSGETISFDDTPAKEDEVVLIESNVKRAGALKTLLKEEGYPNIQWITSPGELPEILRERSPDRLIINGKSYPADGSWKKVISDTFNLPQISYYNPTELVEGQEYSYQDLSESLIGLAAAFVRKNLEHLPHRIQEISTRVRYCKLLALKLELFQTQVDALVLAAWFSAFEKEPDLIRQFETPFRLEEIICPHYYKDKTIRAETAILKLVSMYQALKKKDPRLVEDLDRLRRILINKLPSTGFEAYLEIFLSLIKNEAFLKNIDKPAGRILFVDPSLSLTSPPAIRLANDGFEVEVVSDAGKALKRAAELNFDLIISETKLPDINGLKFCRLVRSKQSTANIPFFFLTEAANDRLPIESLEAGADDFIQKSGDLELLSLKIQKALNRKSPPETNGGVSGSLHEMSPVDFIQSLSANEKSVKIAIENGTQSGLIYIEKGHIVHAQTGNVEGETALYQTAVWEEGTFQIVPCSTFPARTIQGSTLSLLLEATRLADEAMEGENE